eukprot:GFUD01042792.1.p1 GENE.GFUD01042792.1~~GFUD01042792.1.p1  ORF type:complete len:370 (+),score=109.64 GFUD01042792.1:86-1195(+)
MSLTTDLDKEGSMKSVRPRLITVKRGRGASLATDSRGERIGGDYQAKEKDEVVRNNRSVTSRMPHCMEGEKYRAGLVATNNFVTRKNETVAIDEVPTVFYNPDVVSNHKSVLSPDQIRPILRRTSPAKQAPLRPPLQPTQLLNYPIGQNRLHTDWSGRSEIYHTSSGPRDQVLPYQTQQLADTQQLSLLEREKQIALVEKIKEEIECRMKEEELTMQFIAKLSLNDQRQQQNVTESVSASATSTEPVFDRDCTMEKLGGVQTAHQQRRWDGNVPLGWYGNEMQPVVENGETFKDVLVHGNSRGGKSNYVKKKLGAKQRSKKYEEEKKGKATVELKLRIADQERRARIEKEILGREWKIANMRNEEGEWK